MKVEHKENAKKSTVGGIFNAYLFLIKL